MYFCPLPFLFYGGIVLVVGLQDVMADSHRRQIAYKNYKLCVFLFFFSRYSLCSGSVYI